MHKQVQTPLNLTELKPLAEFAVSLGVNPKTVYRWTVTGSRGVILASWIVGSNRRTTAAAVEAFIQKRTGKSNGPEATATQTGTRERELLKAMGVVSRIG